jgi:hypothetical protein
MKKVVFASLAVAALAFPAVAADQTTTEAAPNAAASAALAPSAAAPSAVPANTAQVELKDGSWAKVATDGMVTVSSDGGKTWTKAPDGTWVSKDGMTTITVKDGKKV